jgi:ATP-dependent DNA helicase RecQ
MTDAKKILHKYWNYDSFIFPQEEIIDAVINQNDVITLLPTGGGKSICFQVPALLKNGVCIVISPLISLIQDQVENLKSRGIKATSIPSGASQNEILTLFDNIKFGNFKFLYISPERLQAPLIQEKIKQLTVSFVAVDEAHCISEWGHDFRPSFRNITVLRELIPNVHFIALTATANKQVLDDIEKNLELKTPKIFRKSFFKTQLAYQIFTVEDKLLKLQQIFEKTKTPAIIYVNSRNKTQQIAQFLSSKNFKSSFYHGGLTTDEKGISFENWMSEKTPIMVATNAFGMGIDKENVGVVIHFDIPYSIENYIQEAGRAGRNHQKAFAVLLKNDNDISNQLEFSKKSLPSLNEVKEIHRKLYQYFRIANGEIPENLLGFNLSEFSKIYNFSIVKVDAVLRILANNSIIEITNTYNKKSSIIFHESSKNLHFYAINNIYINNFINSLLRTYTGLFEQEVKIDEFLLAKKNNTTSSQIISYLEQLEKDKIITYNNVKTDSEIRFLVPREDDKTINRFSKEITQFIKQKEKKSTDFLRFIENKSVCRSIQILAYFDEKSSKKCGICDVCLSEKKITNKDIFPEILNLLQKNGALSSQEINQFLNFTEKDILLHLRQLIADEKININNQNKYFIN